MKRRFGLLLLITLQGAACQAGLPEAAPASVGIDPARLARLDALIETAVAQKTVPGVVVLIGRHGKIVYARASGSRAIEPTPEPMTRDTLFDLASLTKPVATATSIMILVEEGKLLLSDRLGRLLPEFDNLGKGQITVEQLLRHRSGLIADNPLKDFADGPESSWKRMAALDLIHPPGTSYEYSDVGFLILGRLVEKISGKPLDVFSRERIFVPLGMTDTQFRPVEMARAAPTEPSGNHMLRGEVHDPRARALGGVAGHAGLFGSADDLAVFAQTLLNLGRGPNGYRLLSPLTVRAMSDPAATPARERRGLGWDVDTPQSGPRGDLFGPNGFGHTGFTGTSLWIDRETDTIVIVMTSRLHPDGKGRSPGALRSQVATLVASSVMDAPAGLPGAPVLCGVDVLAREGFAPLRGRRVGLVTNHTGLTREGVTTIDALHQAEGVKLVALFSPEHGIRGLVDAEVGDARDPSTGLPIHSLYGKTRKPSPAMLEGVDVLVYDIQDIGARFYTYISTLGLVMEAAKAKGIPLYVLDRPNPIGGLKVAGPVRDPEFASFIAHHELPVRHGMTVGELALLFNAERSIAADLHVIPCQGWRRGDLYDRTGLLWVNPSPNMRSLTEALLYPGVGLLEATNLATGRGTDTPFERVGAPWIDPRGFAEALANLRLPGVGFLPVKFTPNDRQYKGEVCGGVYLSILDRDAFDPVALGIGMAYVLHRDYPQEWKPEGFLKMLADQASYKAMTAGRLPMEIQASWNDELKRFREIRSKYLIYPVQTP